MGSIRIKMSVAMENPALAYQFFVRSMQLGFIDLSQAPRIGVHWKIDEAIVATM
jgi:hypothetical protein